MLSHTASRLPVLDGNNQRGRILSEFLWARIGRQSVARIMLLAPLLACTAGLMALGIEFGVVPQTLFCYALVFVAAAMA